MNFDFDEYVDGDDDGDDDDFVDMMVMRRVMIDDHGEEKGDVEMENF